MGDLADKEAKDHPLALSNLFAHLRTKPPQDDPPPPPSPTLSPPSSPDTSDTEPDDDDQDDPPTDPGLKNYTIPKKTPPALGEKVIIIPLQILKLTVLKVVSPSHIKDFI